MADSTGSEEAIICSDQTLKHDPQNIKALQIRLGAMYQQGQTGQDLSEFIIRQEVNGKLKISRALCEFAVSIVLDDDAQAELGEKAATEAEELNSAQKKWLVDHLEKSGLTALALEVL